MFWMPTAVEPLALLLRPAFFTPTYRRFVLLLLGAILGSGRRSVSRILLLLLPLVSGHPCSYHRVFSAARWSMWVLARALCDAILARVPPTQLVYLAVDDTITEHPGQKVYGKAVHRDPVRSSHSYHAMRHGHRWVVLSMVIDLPFASRPWALPVMAALAHTPRSAQAQHLRHKTPCQLACGMILRLLRWYPNRRFIVLGDWGFGHHQFAHRLRRLSRGRLELVARIRADARLFAAPARGARPYRGRPRVRGRRLPSPKDMLQNGARLCPITVQWYGGQQRPLQYLSAIGLWYWARGKGVGIVLPIRWVYVYDPQGKRYDCFFSTDLSLSPTQIIEYFSRRWSLEVTFQECRAHLGLETPRQRTRRSVLRTTPCLLGLFSLVSLCYARLLEKGLPPRPHGTPCYHKQQITFSDALWELRRHIWQELFALHPFTNPRGNKSPPPIQDLLLEYLAAAA